VLWEKLRSLCAYLCGQYRIRPTQIFGHRDFKDTACPGDVLYTMLPKLRSQVADVLREDVTTAAVELVSWPLLRVADRGPRVQAAQHLLRASGETDVQPDGRFDRRTADAVRHFQRTNGTEEVNGMIGGESWPLLVAPIGPAVSRREMARAAAVLTNPPGAPSDMDVEDWQRLLARKDAGR
jgi:peptidoglycan hydrolase-like protein with peptidoglycan-binding domain